LAYNLGNFMRTLAMPKTAEPWSLTSLREKLIKIGAEVVSHGRYLTFQMAVAHRPVAGTTRASMTERSGQMRWTTTPEVRLDAAEAARFQRLGVVNWQFRPPGAPRRARFPVARDARKDDPCSVIARNRGNVD
jgi:hypothetical protein